MPIAKKYTKAQEDELAAAYIGAKTDEERLDVVEKYSSIWKKSERSIIAKLSKMKVYQAKENISKVTGGAPRTKEQLVKDIAYLMHVKVEELPGLEKAGKLCLLLLKERLM